MSYLLRHNPENLKIDTCGFVRIDELLKKLKERFGTDQISLREIVEKSDRQRFEIAENKIRALYGHTIPVELEFIEDKSVKRLYHGTTPSAVSGILRSGLKPMKRKWVHLSPTKEIAAEVASRKTRQPVILEINVDAARKAGLKFGRATENVYLASAVPPRYLRIAKH